MNMHSAMEHRPEPSSTPSHVGRRAARANEIRSRLLDAAESLIAERQASAITARDVARSAGVSDGVLYNHFADKHELILAALVRRFEQLVDVFRSEIGAIDPAPQSPELEAGLERIARAALRLQAGALPMLANVLSEPALFSRFMVAMHRPRLGGDIFMDPIEGYVRDELDSGRTGEIDPAAATDLLVGAILLLALLDLVALHPSETTEARLRGAVRTLVVGLAPRPSAG